MTLLHAGPVRWIAAGAAALTVTIYSALMLGLNVPSVRAVPLAPWAEGGYGADRVEEPAAAGIADPVKNHSPSSRVAGVRIPSAADSEAPAAPASPAPAPAPAPPPAVPAPRPAPLLPAVPAIPSLPGIDGVLAGVGGL
ncbi:MAG TPA: hypothetical protein VM841_07765 [Actinomycetota bacterium]|nr:hypothetical protein [Actinomycetota bacterium]